MAEFIQTMKDWRRMCKHYTDESMKTVQLSCMDMCPLGHNSACGMIEDALDSDIEAMAKEVAKWAAEHPEPVYPTWGEWFVSRGMLPQKWDEVTSAYIVVKNYVGCLPNGCIPNLMHSPIPADIAENLGVKPKEGV